VHGSFILKLLPAGVCSIISNSGMLRCIQHYVVLPLLLCGNIIC
jgi:hypothetical protein